MRYLDRIPKIHPNAKIFETAIVIGDVTIEENCNIWFHATLRGDMAPIKIGSHTNIQDNAVIHTNIDLPTTIGKYVTVGHGAIVHAATIGDYALIGMGAILLDGAVVGDYAMVGAGCLVPPGKVVPPRTLVVGNPMKIVRELTNLEIDSNLRNTEYYLKLMNEYEE